MVAIYFKVKLTQGFFHPQMHFLGGYGQVFKAKSQFTLNRGCHQLIVRILENHANSLTDFEKVAGRVRG